MLVVEAEDEPGGYCRTVVQDGFVWDYSGHFFHFKHPHVEHWLRARMPGQDIRTVVKKSFIRYAGLDIDFPFQKNIHQLPQEDFIDCLHDLYFRDHGLEEAAAPGSFAAMLYARYGRGIAERFLIPYNEKLYATDLSALDVDAMGRFFPHADIADIVANMRPGTSNDGGYNATFTYPAGGAIEYVRALLARSAGRRGQRAASGRSQIDPVGKTATTTRRTHSLRRPLVSSAPLPALARACGVVHDADAFSWNAVLVFNLGFDRKGRGDTHWMYFPDRATSYYRVGWYDNILGARSHEPLRRDRRAERRDVRCRCAARSCGGGSRARGSRRRSPSRLASPRGARSGVRAHHAALARRDRARAGSRSSTPPASTRSAATAAGPTARSRTT